MPNLITLYSLEISLTPSRNMTLPPNTFPNHYSNSLIPHNMLITHYDSHLIYISWFRSISLIRSQIPNNFYTIFTRHHNCNMLKLLLNSMYHIPFHIDLYIYRMLHYILETYSICNISSLYHCIHHLVMDVCHLISSHVSPYTLYTSLIPYHINSSPNNKMPTYNIYYPTIMNYNLIHLCTLSLPTHITHMPNDIYSSLTYKNPTPHNSYLLSHYPFISYYYYYYLFYLYTTIFYSLTTSIYPHLISSLIKITNNNLSPPIIITHYPIITIIITISILYYMHFLYILMPPSSHLSRNSIYPNTIIYMYSIYYSLYHLTITTIISLMPYSNTLRPRNTYHQNNVSYLLHNISNSSTHILLYSLMSRISLIITHRMHTHS